ncbi:GT-D fold domain-containing glycosyltransferase [Paenibacillus sp. GD4]|uniref:GT-D fold domain-containing protein n=1 Tax=Paenibacillus sp. GD4 TaxID=3068890 RepID=UPI0027966A1E|nr:GT-D fold domain-containing glycosyltransferase [Paenibacillus sp. GD4]MDQ1912285.1 GT-D fold domain-containing glycosyltransferase [Paenibacillus sp. GD4]
MSRRKPKKWLKTVEVIARIKAAMEEKRPFSLVRVGDGENLCLAQYKIWPIRKVLATRWAQLSRTTNLKGVRLPNTRLRDQMIAAIKKADLVGIPHKQNKEILAKQSHLRPLTDACFAKYNIKPKDLCHTFVNRHMVEYQEFWEMLRGKKVVFISRWAKDFKKLVNEKYNVYDIKFIKAIKMSHYQEIPKVMAQMKSVQCDIVLISAGVNAVILAQKLAEEQGRVAIDFGKSAIFMITRDPKVKPFDPKEQSQEGKTEQGGEQA